MTYARIGLISGLVTLAACPSPSASTTDTDVETSTTTEETSTSTTRGTTTTGSVPTTGAETDAESTGTPSTDGPARIYYISGAGAPSLPRQLRLVEIAEGVASAPETVIDIGPGSSELSTSVAPGQQTLAISAALPGAVKLWFIDTATAETSELGLPPAIGSIDQMEFSPDGSRLLLSAGSEGKRELYMCQVGPGDCAPGLMSPPLQGAGTIELYSPLVLSNANTWLAYSADFNGDGGLDIMVGRADAPGVASNVLSFLSPAMTLQMAAFTADEKFLYFGLFDSQLDRRDFFAVDLSQAPLVAVPLAPPMAQQPSGWLAPDLHALLMWDGQGSRGDLWMIPIDGVETGEPVWLTSADPGRVSKHSLRWAPDSGRAAFLADHEVPGTDELYVVDSAGLEAPVKVSAPVAAGGSVEKIDFAPDSSRLLYYAHTEPDVGLELFLADPAMPGAGTKLSSPLPPSGGIAMHRWSDDSTRLLYVGAQESANIEDLFVVGQLDGAPTTAAKVNGALPAGNRVLQWFQLSSDGQRAFYQTGPDYNSGPLFMAALADGGPEAPVQLSEPGEEVWYMLVFPPAP